jgi:hypothetical protein
VAVRRASAAQRDQLAGLLPQRRVVKHRGPPAGPDGPDACAERLRELHDLSRLLKDGQATDNDQAK